MSIFDSIFDEPEIQVGIPAASGAQRPIPLPMIDLKTRFRLAPGHRLQWEEAQKRYVLLYPEGLVELNLSAAEILKLCDGRTLEEIVSELERKFETSGLMEDISEFLQAALAHGWVRAEE